VKGYSNEKDLKPPSDCKVDILNEVTGHQSQYDIKRFAWHSPIYGPLPWPRQKGDLSFKKWRDVFLLKLQGFDPIKHVIDGDMLD